MDYSEIVKGALQLGRSHLLEPEGYRVCEQFGIPFPRFMYVSNLEDGINAAQTIGFPVVIKVVSPQVIHKTDVGGVVVGIQSEEQFIKAYHTIMGNVRNKIPSAEVNGMIVQKAMPAGIEIAIGGSKDAQFGPVIMFGAGGTLIELLQDVSFRLAKLDREEAMKQIENTRIFKILQGTRQNEPCNIEALADLIVRTGDLLVEAPEISELDFNPVLVYPDRCVVVDARIVL